MLLRHCVAETPERRLVFFLDVELVSKWPAHSTDASTREQPGLRLSSADRAAEIAVTEVLPRFMDRRGLSRPTGCPSSSQAGARQGSIGVCQHLIREPVVSPNISRGRSSEVSATLIRSGPERTARPEFGVDFDGDRPKPPPATLKKPLGGGPWRMRRRRGPKGRRKGGRRKGQGRDRGRQLRRHNPRLGRREGPKGRWGRREGGAEGAEPKVRPKGRDRGGTAGASSAGRTQGGAEGKAGRRGGTGAGPRAPAPPAEPKAGPKGGGRTQGGAEGRWAEGETRWGRRGEPKVGPEGGRGGEGEMNPRWGRRGPEPRCGPKGVRAEGEGGRGRAEGGEEGNPGPGWGRAGVGREGGNRSPAVTRPGLGNTRGRWRRCCRLSCWDASHCRGALRRLRFGPWRGTWAGPRSRHRRRWGTLRSIQT